MTDSSKGEPERGGSSERSGSARQRVSDAATVGSYKFGALAAKLMPGPMASLTATGLGFGASFASPAKRAIIERHLQRVNPKLRGASLRVAVQQAFDSYARYYVESFRLPSLNAKAVDKPFSVEGFEHVEAAVEQGNGCIFALPHLGGWEWAGRWMTDRGYKLTVVVEALDPPELFQWFADLRKELGMTVVPTGSGAAAAVAAALKRNEIVCLLRDRDIERNGVEVTFFGYAVHVGTWRLIHDVVGNTTELYNLEEDPAELHNRADSEPERLAAMRATMATWLDSTESVRPIDPGTDTGSE